MVKALEKLIEENPGQIECVFSDIFDTLILRRVHPEDTKRIASKRLQQALGIEALPEEIYRLRSQLEQDSCLENQRKGLDLEFAFDEAFLQRFQAMLLEKHAFGREIDQSSFAALCREIELDVEHALQTLDLEMIAVLRKAKGAGLKVYGLSDFYLPSSLMKRLFAKHDILSLFEDVFVSCDHGLTKRSGRLYDLVLQKTKVRPEKILMVGDNEQADKNGALSRDIRAHLLDRAEQREFYQRAARNSKDPQELKRSLSRLIERHARENRRQKIYFTEFAFTLYAFIEKLHQKLSAQGVKDVFFLSREGEFLKHLFEAFQDINGFGPQSRIEAHYLLVSRRSTFIASLKPLCEETFDTLFRQYRALSLDDFLNNLNFSREEARSLAEEISIDAEEKFEDFPHCEAFRSLLGLSFFREKYESLRLEQKGLFKKYLAGFGSRLEDGLHLVDVGWKGTIQDHVFRIFDGEVPVQGYYLGLISPGAAEERNRKTGLLFSYFPETSPYYGVYNDNRPLFEVLLGASHGSARGYRETPLGIEVETEPLEQEKLLFEGVIKPIQGKLSPVFREIAERMAHSPFSIQRLEELLAMNHARLAFLPKKEEVEFFSKLHHYENFGLFETSTFRRSERIHLGERLNNLLQLLRAPRETIFSGWWAPLTLEQRGLGFLRPLYGHLRFYKTFRRFQP